MLPRHRGRRKSVELIYSILTNGSYTVTTQVKIGESFAIGIDSVILARIKILSVHQDGSVNVEIQTPFITAIAELIDEPKSV